MSKDFCFSEKKTKEKLTEGQNRGSIPRCRKRFPPRVNVHFFSTVSQSSSICTAPACSRMRQRQGTCWKSQALAVAPLFGHVKIQHTLGRPLKTEWTRSHTQFITEKQVCYLHKKSPNVEVTGRWVFSLIFSALPVSGDYHVQFLRTSYEDCNYVPVSGAHSKFCPFRLHIFACIWKSKSDVRACVCVCVCVNVRCYWPMRCMRARSESNADGYLTSLTNHCKPPLITFATDNLFLKLSTDLSGCLPHCFFLSWR